MSMADELLAYGEYFLAGYVKNFDASPWDRCAEGIITSIRHAEFKINLQMDFAPASSVYCAGSASCHAGFNGYGINVENFYKRVEAAKTPELKKAMLTALEIYKRDSMHGRTGKLYGEFEKTVKDIPVNAGNFFSYFSDWQGHATVDYKTLLEKGLPFIKKSIEKSRQGIAADSTAYVREHHFLDTMERLYDAVVHLIERFTDELKRLCGTDIDGGEKKRAERLVHCFNRMLEGPPKNFFQALQFYHFYTALDAFDNAGRIDANLAPFYCASEMRGETTYEEAVRLLSQVFGIWGGMDLWNMAVAGRDANGQSIANELTLAVLDARKTLKTPKPGLSFCLNDSTPDSFVFRAFDSLAEGTGHPAFYNDNLYVNTLIEMGYPAEDAAGYAFGGCSETHIPGCGAARDSFFNMATALECALHGYFPAMESGKLTVKPLRTKIDSFENFFAHYKKILESMIDAFVEIRNETQKEVSLRCPAMIRSLFINDCIAQKISQSEGGARYSHGLIDVYGTATVADSLYAVDELVFKKRAVSLQELAAILKRNYEGEKDFLHMCLSLPKYGNDDSKADKFAKEVFDHAFGYIKTKTLWNGGCYYGFCASAPGSHVIFGRTTGATPDGRLAGESLSNSAGPTAGCDVSGPTALLKSVTAPRLSLAAGTPVVNLSLSPENLKHEFRPALLSLLKSFFSMGGMQLQFNFTDAKTLIEAQKNPRLYQSLIVRVAGYSARFADLDADLQDELIKRTVHSI